MKSRDKMLVLLFPKRLLPTRESLLDLIPPNALVAEVGVHRGDFAREILKRNPRRLYLIDSWPKNKHLYNHPRNLSSADPMDGIDGEACYRFVKTRFRSPIARGQVLLIRQDSAEALQSLPDKSLHWIYIDSSHRYDSTKRELWLAGQKVKDSGFICGHDLNAHGVSRAVYEFCIRNDWEIESATVQENINPSFCLRRLSQVVSV